MVDDRQDDSLEELLERTRDLEPSDALVDAVMARVSAEHPDELETLLAKTSDLSPSSGFTDRVSAATADDLPRLLSLTAEIGPSVGFADVVMARVLALPAPRRPVPKLYDGIRRAGFPALVFAAAAAAAAVGVSFSSENALDAGVIASFELVEADE